MRDLFPVFRGTQRRVRVSLQSLFSSNFKNKNNMLLRHISWLVNSFDIEIVFFSGVRGGGGGQGQLWKCPINMHSGN